MSEDQTRLIEALQGPDAYPHETDEILLIETHISWVLLTGDFAYKLKKAVKLPFLDFSTLEAREHYCRDELKLNSRLAPELYLEVVVIGGRPDAPRIGAEPIIEYAVRMRQFPAGATADRLVTADALEARDFAALAERIARFHTDLRPATGTESGEAVRENLDEIAELIDLAAAGIAATDAALRDAAGKLTPLCGERERGGFVRECHGDLHLGNIARVEGRLLPFDCLEFDRDLRTVDVIDEIAFLWMDLLAHGAREFAFGFLNRYLELTGDYEGLRLLRYYAAHRALVRAKVALLAQDGEAPITPDERATRYLEAAEGQLEAASAPLIITVGLSGSGKSTLAAGLAAAFGAVHLRSDVERKRLHEMAPTERRSDGIGEGLYGTDATEATYRRLAEAAAAALSGRLPVIVDASFLERERRQGFRDLARREGTSFLILHCEAAEATLRDRIRERQRRADDPSDADERVLDHQLDTADPLDGKELEATLGIDTETTIDYAAIAAVIAERCQPSLSSTSY